MTLKPPGGRLPLLSPGALSLLLGAVDEAWMAPLKLLVAAACQGGRLAQVVDQHELTLTR
jgi:hypothetical protein